jgi:hypothetical protein
VCVLCSRTGGFKDNDCVLGCGTLESGNNSPNVLKKLDAL